MKLRVIDRLLIALCGVILLALSVWMALDATRVVTPISEVLSWLLSVGTIRMVWLVALVCAALALLGIYEISILFRRRKGKRGFVTQRSENGEIAISVKSIESLVTKCAQKHGEITVQSVAVEEARDGLIIRLRATLASGMNIPLAVGTLQRQIKQYITACTGVDVREVRVKVESTDKAAEDSPYAVPDEQAALPVEQPEPAPMPAEAVAPVELPEEEPEPAGEERELLTHQRLFSTVEEPAMVPEPPELPSEEEIEAEAEMPVADAAEPDTAWVEENEAHWDDAAAAADAQDEAWEAAAEDEPGEPDAAERPDDEKTTEE